MNGIFTSPKCVRSTAVWAVAGILMLAAGCGSSSSNGSGGGGGNQGFSKASLNGNYTFTLRGISTPDTINSFFFVEGGVFTADGNGTIRSGIDDFVQNSQMFSDNISGTYVMNSDGSGDLQFNFPQGGSAIYHITMSDTSHFYMEQADGVGTSGGSGEKQTTSAFTAIPSGTFVFQAHDLVGTAKVGQIKLTSGNITGSGDVLNGGVLVTPVTISGTAQAPDTATGRGSLTITDDTGTNDYAYYVVNDSKIRLFNLDALSSLSIGQAEGQTGGPFSLASLSGTYVFGSAGETTFIQGIHSVGLFTSDGGGNVTSGSFDTVQDGTPVTNMSLSATPSGYSVDATTGRVALTLNLSTGGVNQKVMYLISPSRAYFLINDPTNVEDGTLDKQSGGPFSNASMNGQSALLMDGFDANQQLPFRDRVGTWTPNGSGSISTSYVASGYLNSVPPQTTATSNNLAGTYSVPPNGRATASINNLSNNLILYLRSANSAYLLQADPGVDIGGAFTVQTKP